MTLEEFVASTKKNRMFELSVTNVSSGAKSVFPCSVADLKDSFPNDKQGWMIFDLERHQYRMININGLNQLIYNDDVYTWDRDCSEFRFVRKIVRRKKQEQNE